MPVSGSEETGVKPAIPWNSSDYPAGIPIKKRRYPMIRPPSPPPEDPSSSPADGNSLQKDQSSPSQGPTLTQSRVAKSSSCLSGELTKPEPEERRGSSHVVDENALKANDNLAKVKVEEHSLIVPPDSLDSLKKLAAVRNPVNQIVSGKSELNLGPTESLASDVVNKHVGHSSEVKVAAKAAMPEKTEQLLGLKEHACLVLSSQTNDRSDLNVETSEPISLKLSLSKESASSSHCKSDVADESTGERSHLCADRANWDLNTPMDKWLGPLSDIAASQTLLGGNDVTHDVRPTRVSVISDIERENLANLFMLSNVSSQQYKSGDSLNIQVSPRLQLNGKEQFSPTLKLNSDKVIPSAVLPRVIGSSGSFNKVNVGTVKSEPVDESLKLETRGAEPSKVVPLDSTTVKGGSVNPRTPEALKSLPSCAQKPVDPRPIKPEPAFETNKPTFSTKEGKSLQLNEKVVQDPNKHSSAEVVCKNLQITGSDGKNSLSAEYKQSAAMVTLKTAEVSSPVGSSLFPPDDKQSSSAAACTTTEVACPIVGSSTELARSGDLSINLGPLSFTDGGRLDPNQEACAPDSGAMLTSIDGKVERAKTGDSNVDNNEICKSEVTNDLTLNSRGNGVGAGSEEEKVNVSADIEVSYGTDYESDCNHAVDMSIDMEIDSEDDYEDGEVRESLEHIAVKEPGYEKGQLESNRSSDLNAGNDGLGVINDANLNSFNIVVQVDKTDTAETEKDAEETLSAGHNVKFEKGSGKAPLLQDSSTIENPPVGALLRETSKAMFRSPLVQSGLRGVQEYQETDSGHVFDGGVEPLPTILQGSGLCVSEDDLEPKHDMGLNKSSTNVDNAVKDIDNGSHRSRIINLPRSSDSSSPGSTRTFSGRLLPARAERERFSDLVLEGDNIHSRGREDVYVDGMQKFSRERHYDQTQRNSRLNFMQGRATISRLDNLRGDRESNPKFTSEFYDGPAGFRVPRHKFAASISDADLEYNSYNVSQDVPFVGSGRGGRKPLNDGGAFVRRVPSRRRSPGAARGMHMVRRISRNISPNRSVTDNGSELVRPRRNMRGFRDDGMDPMFSHSQPSYEALDGHFPPGNRNFPSVQRRVMHRIRSKSPLGPRTRSPGAWSSPRRRSPDGFSGHPDLPRQRSPPFYRIERMRSPDRRFPGEVMVRRQDMREMDSGRDHGHPGSGMPNNRSPQSRIVIRERRFGGLDTQERREGDEFYGGPMHSGRMHELGGEANGEERRFADRRGPLRPYRTSFNNADGESFHLNSEDGSRPMRFCSDDNSDSQERANLVERDFNRRIKSRPVNGPRRMRNIDDQEGNYRHGNQVWHNNSFDEMSRVKRKRY